MQKNRKKSRKSSSDKFLVNLIWNSRFVSNKTYQIVAWSTRRKKQPKIENAKLHFFDSKKLVTKRLIRPIPNFVSCDGMKNIVAYQQSE